MSRQLYIDNYVLDTPIIDILYALQLKLTNGKLKDITIHGDNIVVTCPNNEHSGGAEKKAACNIYIGENSSIPYGFARCFVCGYQADFALFVATCFDSTLAFAKNWLKENFGTVAFEQEIKLDFINIDNKQSQKYLDKSILSTYQSWCPYLAKRKLSREICEEFQVKYDPVHRQVIFPVFDYKGNLLMLPKRSIDSKVFYLDKDCEKPVYGLDIVEKNNVKAVVWCEGPFDCLSFWSHGIPAVCSFGSPSEKQIDYINKSCVITVYLGCDNDSAGRQFNKNIQYKLDKRLITYELTYPINCKDANDMTEDQWAQFIKKYNLPKYKNS